MDKKVIKINEVKIREMVSKALNEALNEFTDIMKFPPGFVAKKGREWQIDRIKKEAEKHPDLDPNGFQWVGDTLRHNDKKKPKSVPQPKVSKPDGMDDVTYLTQFVPKYNKRFAKGILTAKEVFSGEEPEKYEPIDVSDFMDAEYVQNFADRYYISQYGVVYISNSDSTSACHVCIPYFNKDRKMYQVNLYVYGENRELLRHTCPSAVGLVRKVFGDKWANRLLEIEKEQIKNNKVITNNEETDF